MCQSDKSRYGELLNLLANVFFRSEENDVHILKPSPSGNFSMKSFYLALEGPPQPRSITNKIKSLSILENMGLIIFNQICR